MGMSNLDMCDSCIAQFNKIERIPTNKSECKSMRPLKQWDNNCSRNTAMVVLTRVDLMWNAVNDFCNAKRAMNAVDNSFIRTVWKLMRYIWREPTNVLDDASELLKPENQTAAIKTCITNDIENGSNDGCGDSGFFT